MRTLIIMNITFLKSVNSYKLETITNEKHLIYITKHDIIMKEQKEKCKIKLLFCDLYNTKKYHKKITKNDKKCIDFIKIIWYYN